MAIDFLYPQYEVVRNPARCIACRACEEVCPQHLEVSAFIQEVSKAFDNGPGLPSERPSRA